MRYFLKARPIYEAAALALALLALASPAIAQNHTMPLARTVQAETMARAGLTRTADLFWLLEGWSAPSLDGYTVRPTAHGMPGAPLLVAGGQPFAGGPFGQPPLPVLPVHLEQVRAAEVSAAPQLVAGRLAPNGAVRLRLRPPADEASARAAISAGNEVGDPGPFRTTERSVPNVDRIGPQYFAETSLGGVQADGQLSLRALRHYTTDRAIRARTEHVIDTLEGPPLQQLIAPRLALWTDDPRFGQHRLNAHYAILRALPLFETLGYEVPARRRHAKIGLDGAFPSFTNSSGRLRYRLSYTRAAMASAPDRFRHPDRSALMFDWREDRLSAHAALGAVPLRLAGQPLGLRLGLSADYTRAHAGGDALDDPTLLTTRAYARLTPDSSRAFRPRLALLVSQTGGQFGGGALASAALPLTLPRGARQRLSIHLAYVRRPYAAGGPFWYWMRQGLRPPQAPAGQVTLPPSFPASQRLSADLRLRHAFSENGHLALELRARHFQKLTLPRSDFGYDPIYFPAYVPPGGSLVPDLHLRTDAGGQTVRAAVEGERAFPKGLTHRLRYDFFAHHASREGASREAFDQRFERTPRHQVRYTARLAVRDRFSLEGRLTIRSPERWSAYRRAAREDIPYRHRLPTRARLDLTAAKRLWQDHLRLRLALRNLLGAPLRTHPAGPVRRLTLFVSLEASL